MRAVVILCAALGVPLGLAGCGVSENLAATMAVGANAGSVAAIHRTPFDAVYSLVTGKDCSAVRLDRGQSYCRPEEPPPGAQPFCTRSLGVVDCWQQPDLLPGQPRGVAEGPWRLTPAQEANRTRGWP